MEADATTLWCYGIVEWRVDPRNKKFPATPIMRDKSEGPVADVTEIFEKFLQRR